MIIAEGDVLTLCIRLFSELLLGRYSLRLPDPAESLLAQHATSILEENIELLKSFDTHRGDSFNSLILPQSQLAIEAIGHAMAYSAAMKSDIPQPILDIYECSVIRQDPAWYSEHGLTQMKQRLREDNAITRALPHIEEYLSSLNIENYVTAPIISDRAWKEYASTLPAFRGNAIPLEEEPYLQAML